MTKESKATAMHDAALRVLNGHRVSGLPFALFLSNWESDNERQSWVARGLNQARLGLERQLRIHFQMNDVETITVQDVHGKMRIAHPQSWPSLILADETWRGAVAEMVDLADMIALF
jgi:hypothetical protein